MPAPIIVTAMLGASDFAWADGLRRAHYPPERNQVPAHITLFHHLPPSAADELRERLKADARAGRPPRGCPGCDIWANASPFRSTAPNWKRSASGWPTISWGS